MQSQSKSQINYSEIFFSVFFNFYFLYSLFTFFLFRDLERAILKFIWSKKKPRIAKTIFNKSRTSGRINIPDLKEYYRATLLKTAWYLYSDRQVDQWYRIEVPEMNPQSYGHLIIDKKLQPSSGKKR